MANFVIRFDFRSPVFGTPMADLDAAALDMAVFAEQHAFNTVSLSEHHSSDDGYLPSPIILASAIAARTSRICVNVSALIVPLYDPIKLAEDMAVLDHLSRGRVSYVVGIGYRRVAYESLGRDFAQRAKAVVEHVALMRRAWTGEPFEHAGRTIRVRPVPYTRPHPRLAYAGLGTRTEASLTSSDPQPIRIQACTTRVVEFDARGARGLGRGVPADCRDLLVVEV